MVGFLKGRGALILYTKDQAGSVVSVIVNDQAWEDGKMAPAFRLIGSLMSGATGTPLTFRLLSKQREVKKEFVYEKPVPGPLRNPAQQ